MRNAAAIPAGSPSPRSLASAGGFRGMRLAHGPFLAVGRPGSRSSALLPFFSPFLSSDLFRGSLQEFSFKRRSPSWLWRLCLLCTASLSERLSRAVPAILASLFVPFFALLLRFPRRKRRRFLVYADLGASALEFSLCSVNRAALSPFFGFPFGCRWTEYPFASRFPPGSIAFACFPGEFSVLSATLLKIPGLGNSGALMLGVHDVLFSGLPWPCPGGIASVSASSFMPVSV